MCLATALSLTTSAVAMSPFDLPSAMSASTSRSRRVSRSAGSALRRSSSCATTCLRRRSYAFSMSDSPLSRQEIHAAAAAHHELGPEYSDAVVASFLEKVEKEIDARVDARLAGVRPPAPPAERDDLRTLLKGAAVGVGASGLAFLVVGGNPDERLRR